MITTENRILSINNTISGKLKAYMELLKFRLSFLVAFSSGFGYALGNAGTINWTVLFMFCLGGFLISGSAIALRALRPDVRIIGVEPAACAAAKASREAERRIGLPPAETVADGARVSVGEKAWSVISELVDDIVSVEDAEILDAVHFILTRSKLVVEPTGAMTVAALLSHRFRAGAAVAVLSGGNLDPETLAGRWRGSHGGQAPRQTSAR